MKAMLKKEDIAEFGRLAKGRARLLVDAYLYQDAYCQYQRFCDICPSTMRILSFM